MSSMTSPEVINAPQKMKPNLTYQATDTYDIGDVVNDLNSPTVLKILMMVLVITIRLESTADRTF